MSTSCRKRPVTWFVLATLLVVGVTGVVLAGKPVKPPPPPPTPIIATTTDRNFLEVDVDKVACQAEFDLAMDVSGDGTHYRYKVGPAATTNPGVLTGYSAPISKTTPVSFDLTGQAVGDYVLCLQALKLDKRGRIKTSQPLARPPPITGRRTRRRWSFMSHSLGRWRRIRLHGYTPSTIPGRRWE